MEDIKEMVYDEELTHFENNNEFFAQLPLSPISNSSIMSIKIPDVSTSKNKATKPMVPILDLSKLNSGYD